MPETARIAEDPRKSAPLPDLSSQVGDNGPDRDTVLFFAGQFRQAKERIKEAQTVNKKVRQAAKLRGIEVQILDKVIRIADDDDPTEFQRLKTQKRYMEYFDLPEGSQLQLFDLDRGGAPSQEDLLKRAFKDGRERGIQGLFPDEQAYPPTLPEGQEHIKGWNEGQDVLKAQLRKLDETPEPEPKKRGRPKKAKADGNGVADADFAEVEN